MKQALAGVVIGALVGVALTVMFTPKKVEPELPPEPVMTHTVTFTLDEQEPKNIVVDPELVRHVQQGDVVIFVNKTGKEVTVNFTGAGVASPFFGNASFKISPEGSGDGFIEAPTVKVETPEEPKYDDYPYEVTADDATSDWTNADGLQQSPRIRVEPR